MDLTDPTVTGPARPEASAPAPPGYDVFISHSSKDKAAADAVCHALESRAVRCWIAPRDIRPGANWGESILGAISSVKIMVLLLSGNANASPQIQREVERAVHRTVIVIPVRIEEVMPASSLEYFLSSSHWLDAFAPPLERHFQSLADVVQGILQGKEFTPTAAGSLPAVTPRPPNRRKFSVIAGAIVALSLALAAAKWRLQPGQKTLAGPVTTPDASASPGATPNQPVVAVPTVVNAPVQTPTPAQAEPEPEPPAPAIKDFAGNWEIMILNMTDGAGNEAYFRPIRFTVSETGDVSGKASLYMESRNGKSKFVQPPRVMALAGAITEPRNKQNAVTVSPFGRHAAYYRAAEIRFKLTDGTEGKGTLGLTEGMPVTENITLSKGEITGRMYATKL